FSPPPPTSTLFPYTTLFRSGSLPELLPRLRTDPWCSPGQGTAAGWLRYSHLCTGQSRRWWEGDTAKTRPLSSRCRQNRRRWRLRSEEHTSELQSRRDLVCRL